MSGGKNSQYEAVEDTDDYSYQEDELQSQNEEDNNDDNWEDMDESNKVDPGSLSGSHQQSAQGRHDLVQDRAESNAAEAPDCKRRGEARTG